MYCDSRQYCNLGEDEYNCSLCPPDKSFKCPGSNTKCIDRKYVCDGDNGKYGKFYDRQIYCPDGGEESDCKPCPMDKPFMCEMGNSYRYNSPLLPIHLKIQQGIRCVEKEKVCDGVIDCFGTEDEMNCTTCLKRKLTHTKAPDDIICPEPSCISIGKLCDGIPDCPGEADEKNCTTCPSNRPVHCQSNP